MNLCWQEYAESRIFSEDDRLQYLKLWTFVSAITFPFGQIRFFMKMQSVLAFGFACFFFSLLACKEKSDQDCLIGDWKVTYAVDGTGRSCIGNLGNIVRETVIGFTTNKITWVDTDIDGSSGMPTQNISSGSYQWIGNTIDITLVDDGVPTQLNSTVTLMDCNELHLRITFKNSPGMLYREIKATR